MATPEVKGDRNIIKGKLKQKRAKLMDCGLLYVEGKSEELLGEIQKHTEEIRKAVERAAAGHRVRKLPKPNKSIHASKR
jgi:uncharacterized protein YjbJ (UPF0337 family)